jgi:hypothetical protein
VLAVEMVIDDPSGTSGLGRASCRSAPVPSPLPEGRDPLTAPPGDGLGVNPVCRTLRAGAPKRPDKLSLSSGTLAVPKPASPPSLG